MTGRRKTAAGRWRAFYSRGMEIGGCPLSDFAVRIIAQQYNSGMRILDAGCGSGRGIRHLLATYSARREAIDIAGLDFCMEALQLQHEHSAEICGDMFSLPFKPECFDMVIARQVLEGYSSDDISRLSDGFFKVLRNGGNLILDARGPMDSRAAGTGSSLCCGSSTNSFFSRNELIRCFASFTAVDWEEDFRCRKTPSGERLITHTVSMLLRKDSSGRE